MPLVTRRTLFAIALTASLPAFAASASQPIAIEDLARLPAIQSVSMSPDGNHLVALIPSPKNPDETALATWDIADLSKGPKVVTPSGDRMKFIAASALKADKILVVGRQEWTGRLGGCGEGKVSGATKTFVTKVYLTDADQKKIDEAFASDSYTTGISAETRRCLELGSTASLAYILPLDPDRVIIQRLNELALSTSYYLYNLKTNDTELLFRGDPRSTPALFDPRSGKLLAKSQIEPVGNDFEQRVSILDSKSGQFSVHEPLTTKLTYRYTVDVVGIDDATGKFYVLTDQFSDKVQARLYDPVQRKYDPKPLVADENFSIAGLVFGDQPSNFNKLLGFVVDGPHRQIVYVDPTLKAIQDGLKRAFPAQDISIGRYTDGFSKVLFSTESASHPISYHILLDQKTVANLGSQYPAIEAGRTGEERWVTYKARDGRAISAILDLPAGWKQGDAPAPAVINPHGGPWARDYTGWDVSGWVPLLTSRGYAVLRPQYRGSSGLGRDLWIAGDREWGLKMSDDNDDGAAWLVSQGIAAKDRIAIFGYSYGGFAAVAAAVRKPSPYQCAIAGGPVTNLGKLGTSWSDNRLQRILQGETVQGMDPMEHTADATLPILLFVGDRDVRTPSVHAKSFYDAVKGTVPAKLELIPDQSHSMPWYPSQQRTTLGLIENFLKQDCGPGGL